MRCDSCTYRPAVFERVIYKNEYKLYNNHENLENRIHFALHFFYESNDTLLFFDVTSLYNGRTFKVTALLDIHTHVCRY